MASGWDPNIINGFSSNNQNSQPYNPNSFLQDNSFSGGYRGPSAGHTQHLQQQQHQQQQSYCQQQHPAGYHALDQSSRISSEAGGQCRGQQGGQCRGQQGVRLQEQRRPGDWDWGEIIEDEFRKEIGKMASEVAQQKNGEKKCQ